MTDLEKTPASRAQARNKWMDDFPPCSATKKNIPPAATPASVSSKKEKQAKSGNNKAAAEALKKSHLSSGGAPKSLESCKTLKKDFLIMKKLGI
ncbi:hypothetical protein C0995_011441 [Termitomyces sp. Mi166|nr:hypothetical protein C0995_011441 [Termitomyces sp. Mi166\